MEDTNNRIERRENGESADRGLQIVTGKTWYDVPPIHSLRDVVLRGRELYRDQPAVRWRVRPGDRELLFRTYGELARDVGRMQDWLASELPRGSRIALVGDNSYLWMVTWLAVASGFGVIVPIDRLLKPEEVWPILERSRAVMLIHDASWHLSVRAFSDQLPFLTHRVVMDRGIASDETRKAVAQDRQTDSNLFVLDEILEDGPEKKDGCDLMPAPDPQDDVAILFTSGTSAGSKAVILTDRSITADVRALLGSVYFPRPLDTLSILPLHHAFENTCGFLTVLSLGGTIHLFDGLRYIAKNLEEFKVHLMVVVPAVLDAIHRRVFAEAEKRGQLGKLNFGIRLATLLYRLGIDVRRKIMKTVLDQLGGQLRYIICGAAPVQEETLQFFRAIGIEVLAGYGLTEASPVVSGGNTRVNEFGTVGQPLAGVEVAIANGGQGTGEILVRSPIVMKGYLNDPDATAETIDRDGWLHTADIGHFTRKKSLVITGRSKSMIVLASGKKVFPEEIEALLYRHGMVRDALVFGHQGAMGEVVISAKVVFNRDKMRETFQHDPSEEEMSQALAAIIADVNRGLASFKEIRSYFYSLQDMVKTTTLKIRRGVELAAIEQYFARSGVPWQTLRGKNIDAVMNPGAPADLSCPG